MLLYRLIRKRLSYFIRGKKEVSPAEAYNLWAATYDDQPENLLIYLDKQLFSEMTKDISFENKTIADVGCGTGRYWGQLLAKKPFEIIGYDVSGEMLEKLREKYPSAKTHLLNNNCLADTADSSCDVIISNLVVGYIKNLDFAFGEWGRALKNGGKLVITDFHPDSLQKGAVRSCRHNGTSVLIKNYIHTLKKIRQLAKKYHFLETGFTEKEVDESLKFFYVKENALHAFNDSYGTPLIYGLQFTKAAK